MKFTRYALSILATVVALLVSVLCQSQDQDGTLDMRADFDNLDSRGFTHLSTARALDRDSSQELALRSYIKRSLGVYIAERASDTIEDLVQSSVDLDRRAMDTLHLVSVDGSVSRTEQTSLIIATWGSIKSRLRNWTRGREVHWVWQGTEPKDGDLLVMSGVKTGDTLTFRLGAPRAGTKRASAPKGAAKAQSKKTSPRAKKASRK